MSPSLFFFLVYITVFRIILCHFFSVSLDNYSMFSGILGNLGWSIQSLSYLAYSMYSVLRGQKYESCIFLRTVLSFMGKI